MAQPTETINTTLRGRPALLALFVVAFILCCVGAVLLPQDRYIRYQQLGGAVRPGVWIYERLHYDRTPIDVAIIGASRTDIGVSAPQIEGELRAQLGRNVHVANLSLPQDGRDLHYELTRELLATHPEVRLILYSLTEHASRIGHPAFRSVADAGDVLSAPLLLNPEYFDDLVFLPWRQLSVFVQSQLPGVFGVHRSFDPKLYWGTGHDTTISHWSASGHWADRDTIHPASELAKQVNGKVAQRTPVLLPSRLRDYEYALERGYTRRIAILAKQHDVRIGFLYLPIYDRHFVIDDLAFYRARGAILRADIIADDHRNYSDYAHLNRVGTARVSRWLSTWLVGIVRSDHIRFADER